MAFFLIAARQELTIETTSHRAKKEHDRKVAARFRELTTENQVDALFSSLYNADAYFNNQMRPIDRGFEFLSSDEAHFLIEEVRKAANDYVTTSHRLFEFIAYKFFVSDNSPRDNTYFVMTPALNVDRGGAWSDENLKRYSAFQKELYELCIDFREAYRELIKALHRHVDVD